VVTIRTTIFNIHKLYVLPTQCIHVFCVDHRTSSDYFSLPHEFISFYNRSRNCFLRGTEWIFKSDGYNFVLKWLILSLSCDNDVARVRRADFSVRVVTVQIQIELWDQISYNCG